MLALGGTLIAFTVVWAVLFRGEKNAVVGFVGAVVLAVGLAIALDLVWDLGLIPGSTGHHALSSPYTLDVDRLYRRFLGGS